MSTIENTMRTAGKTLKSSNPLAAAEVMSPIQLSTNSACYPVVFLICNPRTVSTAFERSFKERGDFSILHEPYFQCKAYRDSGEKSFSEHDKDIFDKTMSNEELKNYIIAASKQKPVFIKDMVLGIYEPLMSDEEFVRQANVKFTFLIRNPAKVLISYYEKMSKILPELVAKIPEIQRFDQQNELIEHVEQLRGEKPVIIDADDLIEHPTQIIKAFCAANGIDFIEEALNWEPEFDETWRSWGEFHDVVSTSTSFRPTRTESDFNVIPDEHRKMIETHYAEQHPFYKKMYNKRLRFKDDEL